LAQIQPREIVSEPTQVETASLTNVA
jgi:hypothetical protein